MGLDYLNKKVWHPGSIKNIQKVWEVEQQQREINKRARQRAKKLMEEQHNDQLKKIQVEAGLIPRSHLDRMEWMYDWGNKIQQQKTNQEYLTGQKAAKPEEQKQGKHVFQEEITNRKCQDFQLLHEDPMFEIMKHEKSRKDAVSNNPIEMRNIIKEVEKEYLPQDFHERRKQHHSLKRKRSSSRDQSRKAQQKNKNNKNRYRHHSSSSSRSRSRERRSDDKIKSQKSFKQSKVYQNYLKDRFGGILKKDQQGNLKPDYSTHKKRYKTQYQIDQEQRKKMTQRMRENAQKLQELREQEGNKIQTIQKEENYDHGVAKIRADMLGNVHKNRNHKKYRGSDSE